MAPTPQQSDSGHSAPAANTGLLDTADKILKALALLALLVTGLGYPAVMVDFARHGVPFSFLDNTLAIKAGVLPGVGLLVALLILLWLVVVLRADDDKPMREWVNNGTVGKIYAGIVVFFLIPSGLSDAPFLAALSLARHAPTPRTLLSFVEVGAAWAFAAVAIMVLNVVTYAPLLVLLRRWVDGQRPFSKPPTLKEGLKPLLRWPAIWGRWLDKYVWPVYSKPWGFLANLSTLESIVVSWILLGFAYGLLTWWGASIHDPAVPSWAQALRPAALAIGKPPFQLFYLTFPVSMFSFFFALLAQRYASEDASPRSATLRLELRTAAVFFLYLPWVTWYSVNLYPNLPGALAGGKPQPMDLWIEGKNFPKDSKSKLTMLSVVPAEGNTLRLEKCFLIHANSDVIILSDSDEAYAAAMILPRDSVIAISSPR